MVLETFRHKTHPSPATDRLTPITLITTGNQRAYRASNAEMKPLITSSALMLVRQHRGLVVHRVAPTAVKGRSFALAAPRSEVAEGHSIRGKVTSRSPRASKTRVRASLAGLAFVSLLIRLSCRRESAEIAGII